MMRFLCLVFLAGYAAILTGCHAGAVGCHCGNCDGITDAHLPPHSPREHAHRFRKSLICGDGCGDVYYGEWSNYPPDCCDPCDNAQQCTPPIACRPFLVYRLLTGWYGSRAPVYPPGHDCDECFDDCGCGVDFIASESDCGCGGDVVSGPVVGSSGGCASCTPSAFRGSVVRQGPAGFPRAPVSAAPSPRGRKTESEPDSRIIRR